MNIVLIRNALFSFSPRFRVTSHPRFAKVSTSQKVLSLRQTGMLVALQSFSMKQRELTFVESLRSLLDNLYSTRSNSAK